MSDKTRRTSIILNDRLRDLIEELKHETGAEHVSDVVRNAVFNYHRSIFPPYASKSSYRKISKNNEEDSIDDSQIKICELSYPHGLGGKVEEDDSGQYCVYKTYNRTKSQEQKIPLSSVSKDIMKAQFTPSYEKVVELLTKKKMKIYED